MILEFEGGRSAPRSNRSNATCECALPLPASNTLNVGWCEFELQPGSVQEDAGSTSTVRMHVPVDSRCTVALGRTRSSVVKAEVPGSARGCLALGALTCLWRARLT
eukprot:4863649-Pleurochrysis_carterae.AAC.1